MLSQTKLIDDRASPAQPPHEAIDAPVVSQFTLPDGLHPIPKAKQRRPLSRVTLPIVRDLLFPPSSVRLWKARKRAARMTMPEAPVYEDAPLSGLVCDVRAPWKIRGAYPESKPMAVEQAAKDDFGRGVALSDGLHPTSRLGKGPARRTPGVD